MEKREFNKMLVDAWLRKNVPDWVLRGIEQQLKEVERRGTAQAYRVITKLARKKGDEEHGNAQYSSGFGVACGMIEDECDRQLVQLRRKQG